MIETVLDLVKKALIWVVNLLRDSPFSAVSSSPVAAYLGYINWFIPVSFFISTMELWLTAIAVYYAISAILRWVKAVS